MSAPADILYQGCRVRIIGRDTLKKNESLFGCEGIVAGDNGPWLTVSVEGTTYKLRRGNLEPLASDDEPAIDEDHIMEDGNESVEEDIDEENSDNSDEEGPTLLSHASVNENIENLDTSDEDLDIDNLVTKTLQKFSTSKFQSKSTACAVLHKKLVGSGRKKDTKLLNSGGLIKSLSKSSNAIEVAQSKSELYDKTSLTAPPLKPPKVVRPETVGKGWFDMQVSS